MSIPTLTPIADVTTVDKVLRYAKTHTAIVGLVVTFFLTNFAGNHYVALYGGLATALLTAAGVYIVPNTKSAAQLASESAHAQDVADAMVRPHPMAILHQDDPQWAPLNWDQGNHAPVEVAPLDVAAPVVIPDAPAEPTGSTPADPAPADQAPVESAPVGPTGEQIQAAIEVGVQAGLAHFAAVAPPA